MKFLLLALAVTLAVAGSYFFYFRDHPFVWSQGPEVSASPSGRQSASAPDAPHGFKDLCAQLQDDMNRIPASLREPRRMPTHALETRSRLAPYLQLHAEYQTAAQACDLIIDADQAFADHQAKCGVAPAGAGATAPDRAWAASTPVANVYLQHQSLWDNQRQQADGKVRQLLAGLENRRL